MTSIILNNTSIEIQYQQYLIKLSSDLDLINIIIEKDNTIYEFNFNLEYLHKYKLLISVFQHKKLEGFFYIKNKNKIQLKKLININSIHSHNDWINSIFIFLSGNIISTSNDKSIKIFFQSF